MIIGIIGKFERGNKTMKIYKIIMNVSEYNRRKDEQKNVTHKEEIVIGKNNLKYARAVFSGWKSELNSSFSYHTRGIERTGTVQLFIPHVFENGLLAYWPDDNKYILKEDYQDT